MKKFIILCMSFALLCACSPQKDYEKELSNYYLSLTSSSQVDEDTIAVENQVYDFQNKKMTDHNKFEFQLTAQYSLAVYDNKENAILYSAKDKNNNDQVYLYDIETQKTTQLTNHLWGINYIIPRNEDYIVVGAKRKTHILALWSIDKKSHEVKQIDIPHEKYTDMYAWQVAYIPQTNDLIIQATSDSLEYQLSDQWNSQDEHDSEDLTIPFYHYYYHDNQMEYLFSEEMPKGDGLISNGNQVLVAIQSEDHGDSLIQYDIKTKQKKTLEHVSGLGRVFYFDNNNQYLYAFKNGIVRKDIYTGQEEWLDYKFQDIGYYNNFILLKK